MTAAQLAIPTTAIESSAIISLDGVYRYVLTRRWGPGRAVLFVMLNPSTADAAKDDPTIRRCIKHARALGGDALVVVNLYALRSTKPAALGKHADPVGPENMQHIGEQTSTAGQIICAWGQSAFASRSEPDMRASRCGVVLDEIRTIAPHTPLYKLAGADGVGPLHPLARVAGLKPQPWDGRR